MGFVLLDVALHLGLVVVDSVRGETETVGIEPGVVLQVHLLLQVVADAVDQVDLYERLASDEFEYHGALGEEFTMVQDIIYGLLCHIETHALLGVLAHKIAVFECELAVLRHDERDGLGHSAFPAYVSFPEFHGSAYSSFTSLVARTGAR